MLVKIDDTICRVQYDNLTDRVFVDYEGQATSAPDQENLIQELRKKYKTVERMPETTSE